MGGHQGGEVASQLAVETIGKVLGESSEEPEQSLRKAFLAANEVVRGVARADPRYTGMGTTGVALLFASKTDAWVAHVGDSRAYVLRNGELQALTADHSYVAELQRRGILTAAEAAVHPRRNEVLRSIGGEVELEVEIHAVPTKPRDTFLLCTDGLWGCVPEPELVAALASARPEDAAQRLVDLANQYGGPDNVTVQLARIPESAMGEAAIGEAETDASSPHPQPAPHLDRILQVAIVASVIAAVVLLLWALFHLAAQHPPSPGNTAAPPPARDPL
jgi:protein phosphatase